MREWSNHDPLTTRVRPYRLPARDFPNNITTGLNRESRDQTAATAWQEEDH